MALQLHNLTLAAFALLMLTAAFEDFRRLIIPNLLVLALCLLWPLYAVSGDGFGQAGYALGCALLVFGGGALCFARGYVGGGDVKLLTAAALWAGPGGTPALIGVTGLLGGLLALALLTPVGAHLAVAGRVHLGRADPSTEEARPMQVPYGMAIAAAAVFVILKPNFD